MIGLISQMMDAGVLSERSHRGFSRIRSVQICEIFCKAKNICEISEICVTFAKTYQTKL